MEPQLQYPRENARGLRPRRQNFAKAALRAAGKATDLRAAQPETSKIFSDGAKSLAGERDSAWLLVCRVRLLRAGAARPLRSEPSDADPLVRRRCRLLVHLYSNRPNACAQRCLHRSSKGYTLATHHDRARTGEFRVACRSPARTCAVVSVRWAPRPPHRSYGVNNDSTQRR